jgi:hypothetical protein
MARSTNRAGFWNDRVWASIDQGVKTVAGAIRVGQKVFPTVQLAGATVPDDELADPDKLKIPERTKSYHEISIPFSLTAGQVSADPAGTTAITLAKLAARKLALCEDIYIIRHGIFARDDLKTIAACADGNSGDNILDAVSKGIKWLTDNEQAPPFALIAATDVFAKISSTAINNVQTLTVLKAILTGGIYSTPAIAPKFALLIALGGEPTTIYVGSDPEAAPTYEDSEGFFHFRTFERVQYVARDKRAFVKLDFHRYLTRAGTSSPEAGTEAGTSAPKAGTEAGTSAPKAGTEAGTSAPEAGTRAGTSAPAAERGSGSSSSSD